MTGLLYARDALLALLFVLGVFRAAAWLDRREALAERGYEKRPSKQGVYDHERDEWAA